MPSLTLNDRLLWFAHCPKAGGTSVERVMVAQWGDAVGHLHWGWDVWWRQGGWRVADPPNSPQHLVWVDALAALPRAPDRVFALVRDPVARIASEYRWQRQGRRGTRLGKLLALLPFSLWLRLMLQVARTNPWAFDNHLRPQCDFVPDGAEAFQLEDGPEAAFSWLSEVISEDVWIGDMPRALATREETTIGPAERARIGVFYGADYKRFGYDLPTDLMTPDWGDTLAAILAPVVVALDRRGAL